MVDDLAFRQRVAGAGLDENNNLFAIGAVRNADRRDIRHPLQLQDDVIDLQR